MFSLEFEIAALPLTVNGMTSMHWRAKSRYVRGWHILVNAAIGSRRPSSPLARVRLTLTRFSSVAPDSDGLVSSFKATIDALRTSRVILDDKFSNVGMPDYRWEKAKPKCGKITVKVEEIA